MADSTRIDKYIWAIRLFKTRSEATEACNGNKVQLNGVAAKPSKTVKAGDSISVRKGAVQYSYKVLKIAENRMGAQLVPEFAENLTPQSELDKLHAPRETFFVKRDRGSGRPTKKDRREMDALWDGIDFSSDYNDED
ncbi:MAG: RNA-binding S4 domain-containing protein [Rikenellaceae bacterium]|nr:RNA-binding S4 domain-containing protein [Rikenellaceae bacterium]